MPCIFQPECFEVLACCALRRAERDWQYAELALMGLREADPGTLKSVAELASRGCPRRLAIGMVGDAVAMLVAGDSDRVRLRTDSALTAV